MARPLLQTLPTSGAVRVPRRWWRRQVLRWREWQGFVQLVALLLLLGIILTVFIACVASEM
jgi:hypothetical protein